MKKMKTLVLVSALAITTLSVVPVHAHSGKSDMPMMQGSMMEKMQTHMAEMRVVLDAVKEESDPQKREAMLQEHAQKMQDMMDMIQTEHGKGMMAGKGMGHDHGAMSTGDKISMMEMRITMMEEMMAQMMGHTAEKAKPIHKHKKN